MTNFNLNEYYYDQEKKQYFHKKTNKLLRLNGEGENNVFLANLIAIIKDYSKKNFHFEHGIVRYRDDKNKQLMPFQKELFEIIGGSELDFDLEKENYDTSFSHLISLIIRIGELKNKKETSEALDKYCKTCNL